MVGSETNDVTNKGLGFRGWRTQILCNGQPQGVERWALQKYTSITPKTNFKLFNTFADADENVELPGSNWDLTFTDQGNTTKVTVSIYNESLERMERILEMGFVEGTESQLKNLEELLAKLSQK